MSLVTNSEDDNSFVLPSNEWKASSHKYPTPPTFAED